MKKLKIKYISCILVPLFCVACSTNINSAVDEISNISQNNQYVKSGTISIGFNLPDKLASGNTLVNNSVNFSFLDEEIFTDRVINTRFSCGISGEIQTASLTSNNPKVIKQAKHSLDFAPLVGFFPLSLQFKPADNEVWIQIIKDKKQIEVYKGKEVIKVIPSEGKINLAEGEYPLQHKQRNPLWYAPDEYFSKRELRVPPRGDHFRYRRGALGNYALYPTMDFVIHSGPFWSEEVGGLKVSEADLSAIFVMLNVGTPIVVKQN